MARLLMLGDSDNVIGRFSQLFAKYGARKPPQYCDFYETILSPYKVLPISLLEIGIQHGGSLRAWMEYFEQGHVFGIDKEKQFCVSVNHFCGAQSDLEFLSSVLSTTGPLDIVIDDGSHLNKDQQASFNFLFPRMRSGGIYVVEDMHDDRPEFCRDVTVPTKQWIPSLGYKNKIEGDIGCIFKD